VDYSRRCRTQGADDKLRGKPVDHIEDLYAMEQGIPGSLESFNSTTRVADEPGAHGT
jgi:hypothetical protein